MSNEITLNGWDKWELYIKEVETTAVEYVIETCKRWAEFYDDCKQNHGKQGGSEFAKFAKDRFNISQSTASQRVIIGKRAEELITISNKFSDDWRALYDYTRLNDSQKQILLQRDEKINQAAIKSLTYGHKEGDEWYTPKWLFDSLGLEFDIDVCAPKDLTYVTTPARRFLNEESNGLKYKWSGTIWCNPPYSDPEPWALKCIEHGNGLLLSHVPMNAMWCAAVWQYCDGIRLFQAIEFVRPDGTTQRPGYWLQLAAFGAVAAEALLKMKVPDAVAENPRRIPSPMWVKIDA